MKEYFGTKRVMAWPEERDGKPGFRVTYAGGYVSWSPTDAFAQAYQPIDALSFGHAIAAVKQGEEVTRKSWSGERLLSVVMKTDPVTNSPKLALKFGDVAVIKYMPQPADIFANDWMILAPAKTAGHVL
jgi:hypothetical protein